MLLRHIHYFLAVAEHRGFTRAAAALHVSQPALSQQIKQFEDMLGVQLFDRSGRVTRLTDSGEVYLRYAQHALQNLERGKRAVHDVHDLSRGTLHVAATPTFTTYLIGPLIEQFHNLYPNITLTIQEMPQERIEELLVNDAFDIGIAFADVQSPDIEAQPLLVETLALVVGKRHPLAQHRTVNVETLQNESMVLLNSEFATREQIDRCCQQNNIRPRVLMEANSLSAVIEIVQRTKLSTLLPAKTADTRKELIAIPLDPVLLERTAVLLQRKGSYRTAATRAFIELALNLASTEMKK